LHIFAQYVNIAKISQKLRLGCLVLVCISERAVTVESAYVQCRAFSHELPREQLSSVRRVTPLWVASVFALLSCAGFGECGWYRGRNAFRPDCGMTGFFYCVHGAFVTETSLTRSVSFLRCQY